MARAFADITFTDSVKAAQARYGSREQNGFFENAEDPRNSLGEKEIQFIQTRDSFYQATVGENGWPYVQHRGGPPGFLKILDERTFGYADYRGNMQYISVGNIGSDQRVSLILMDYLNRRRLKIWGHAQIVHGYDNPELLEKLQDNEYAAKVERGVVVHVDALEWNCPQHITQRFTEDQVKQAVAPLLQEITELKRLLASYQP
ncbi:MAG: pyridoxamine 5'-phosphate oxidase [Gammaproteobacteria bacterium]|nr:MAG: pyridoxamine 5'-phosphate oxidase [Gammaproteobacteria bacterium]